MLKPIKDEVVMTKQSVFTDNVRSNVCFQSALGFFFNKGVRGGPRVLLNLAGVLVSLLLFVKLLPSRMTESAFQAIPLPKTVWSALGHHQNSGPVGLRIVVFGELDIGTPVGSSQETEDSKSWTEMLCDQLACATYVSMVPKPDTASWSISSNDIYAQGVENVLNETAYNGGSGHDYTFVSASYPPQWKSRDLKAQIDAFLAMPKGPTPVSTLWVISFGQWDVWTLSTLPSAQGIESVGAMTKDIFAQMERLYTASMDPKSIAYSSIGTLKDLTAQAVNATEESEKAEAHNGTEEVPIGEHIGTDDSATAQEIAPEAVPTDEQKQKPTDTFTVLVPALVDPSLLPGWQNLRPLAPAAHSKAEQLRKSVALTEEWNDRIQNRMAEFIMGGAEKRDADQETESTITDSHVNSAGASPRPVRDGFAYNLAGYVNDRIMDRQLRNAHLTDGTGLGEGAIDEGFRNVRASCLQPVDTARSASPGAAPGDAPGDVKLNIANVKLEHDKQAPSSEAAGVVKRAEYVEMPGVAYLSTAKECEIPGDYLFYTPFALSQKAVSALAGEAADLIRNGQSVREKLSKKKE